jgi:hypothetical protein
MDDMPPVLHTIIKVSALELARIIADLQSGLPSQWCRDKFGGAFYNVDLSVTERYSTGFTKVNVGVVPA